MSLGLQLFLLFPYGSHMRQAAPDSSSHDKGHGKYEKHIIRCERNDHEEKDACHQELEGMSLDVVDMFEAGLMNAAHHQEREYVYPDEDGDGRERPCNAGEKIGARNRRSSSRDRQSCEVVHPT